MSRSFTNSIIIFLPVLHSIFFSILTFFLPENPKLCALIRIFLNNLSVEKIIQTMGVHVSIIITKYDKLVFFTFVVVVVFFVSHVSK